MVNRGIVKVPVIAGLVPAISIGRAHYPMIGMAGTSPAMTNWEPPVKLRVSGGDKGR